MWPTLYKQYIPNVGEIPYNTWGLLLVVAFFAAAWVVHVRSAKVGIDPDKMVGVYVISIVGGLVGARLLHFTMATPKEFFANPLIFFNGLQGGFALYGGLILATIIAIVYAKARAIPVLKMVDTTMPAVMLGVSVGRLGCFFAGCCHGKQVILPNGAVALLPESFSGGQLWLSASPPFLIALTRHGVGENNIPLMPTQLYESFAALAIFLVMSWLWKRRSFDGQIMGTTMVIYSLWRPFNEWLRGDTVRGVDYFGLLTTSQVISIPVFLIGVALLVVNFRRGLAPEKAFETTREDVMSGSAPRL